MKPIYAKLANRAYFNDVKFCSVDVDEHPELTKKARVNRNPTYQFYKSSTKIDEVKDIIDYKGLVIKVQEHM